MSVEAHKALIRRRIDEIWHAGNLAVADEIIAADYVSDGQPIRRDGFKQFVTAIRSAFPDIRFTTEDIIAEGDRVTVRYTLRGTHQGAFVGIPATGKTIMLTGIDLFQFAHGQMIAEWLNYDQLGLLQQLGVLPPLGQAGQGSPRG